MLVSPSGIVAFEECQRKWAWRTIDKIPGESNPYAQFGTAVHKILEDYLKQGHMPDLMRPEGECAFVFLHELPPPGTPGLAIEQHFTVAPFHGYIDVLEPPAADGIPTVNDHKTCGSFRYVKESLKDDTQAAIYAHFAFATYPEAPAVRLHWKYGTRARPKLKPIHQVVTREDIAPTLARANATAIRMRGITAKTALELPPNPLACEAYGGCQYRGLCNLTAEQKLTALLASENPIMNQPPGFDKNAFLAQVAGTVGAPPPPTPPAPETYHPPGTLPGAGATHVLRSGAWCDLPATPPPPPVAPPAPIAINPPPVGAAPPIATAPTAPAKPRGRPRKVAGSVAQAEGEDSSGWGPVAEALRALADAVEAL